MIIVTEIIVAVSYGCCYSLGYYSLLATRSSLLLLLPLLLMLTVSYSLPLITSPSPVCVTE